MAISGLDPDRLILDVVEDMLIPDAEAVFAILLRLRNLGVRIVSTSTAPAAPV